jgi:hypothetical protein
VDWEIEEKRATSRRHATGMSIATMFAALSTGFHHHGFFRHIDFTSLGLGLGTTAMCAVATLSFVDDASDESPPRWLYGLVILVGIAGAAFAVLGQLHPQP